ncbi:unnamed protein product, partial [marine sediment metagenome]
MYKGKGNFFRVKDSKQVINEIKYFKDKYDIEFVYFADPDFLVKSRKVFDEFIKGYKDIKLPFWAEARADVVTEYKIKALDSIGCFGFAIGVESGNEFIRNKILQKGVSNKQIEIAYNILKNSNIKIYTNIMIGLPFETREQIFDSINFMRKLGVKHPVVNIFNPYRGSALWQTCVDEGFVSKDKLAGDYRGDYVLDMPQISKEEVLGLQRTFLLYVNFPKSEWNRIKSAETDDEVFEELREEY